MSIATNRVTGYQINLTLLNSWCRKQQQRTIRRSRRDKRSRRDRRSRKHRRDRASFEWLTSRSTYFDLLRGQLTYLSVVETVRQTANSKERSSQLAVIALGCLTSKRHVAITAVFCSTHKTFQSTSVNLAKSSSHFRQIMDRKCSDMRCSLSYVKEFCNREVYRSAEYDSKWRSMEHSMYSWYKCIG